MRIRRMGMVSILVVLAFALPACKDAPAEEGGGGSDLATVEPIEGSDVSQVTLSEEAAARLDIETATVTSAGTTGGKGRTTIPYAAECSCRTWMRSRHCDIHIRRMVRPACSCQLPETRRK